MASDGDDANDGAAADRPVATYARAEAMATYFGASTISLAAGTYTGTDDPLVAVTMDNITIEGHGAIIDGETARVTMTVTADNAVINDLVATRSSDTGITATGAVAVALNRCVSHDNAWMGIYIAAGSHDAVVEACESYANTSRGIYANNALRVAFRRCYAHDNASYGYEFENNADDGVYDECWAYANAGHGFIGKTSQRITMRRCVAWGSHSLAGFYFKGAPNGTMINCNSYGNTRGAYVLNNLGGDGSTDCTLSNNILSGNSRGIEVDADSQAGFASDYNDIVDGLTGYWGGDQQTTLADWRTATSQDAHSQAVDPAYADVTYGGFVLPAGSALLTAGNDGGPIGREG